VVGNPLCVDRSMAVSYIPQQMINGDMRKDRMRKLTRTMGMATQVRPYVRHQTKQVVVVLANGNFFLDSLTQMFSFG
jgi:hypothetical protein